MQMAPYAVWNILRPGKISATATRDHGRLAGSLRLGDEILVYGCGDTEAETIVDHDKNF